jgi:predicted HTH domain antitoxin
MDAAPLGARSGPQLPLEVWPHQSPCILVIEMSHRLTIEYGDDVLLSLGLSPEEFSAEAKLVLAAKLYDLGKLTSGQAARLCGKGRVEFLMSLSRLGVAASNLRPEDADVELDFGRHG